MEKGLQRPLGKGQGHFKCIKSKGQTTSNMFFEVTKVHMFPFVLTVSLKHGRSLFSIILTSMWKKVNQRRNSINSDQLKAPTT